jgi:hypothetical protein
MTCCNLLGLRVLALHLRRQHRIFRRSAISSAPGQSRFFASRSPDHLRQPADCLHELGHLLAASSRFVV